VAAAASQCLASSQTLAVAVRAAARGQRSYKVSSGTMPARTQKRDSMPRTDRALLVANLEMRRVVGLRLSLPIVREPPLWNVAVAQRRRTGNWL
jgi:hypothetical protein